MSAVVDVVPGSGAGRVMGAAELLGGPGVFGTPVSGALDAHELVLGGLRGATLAFLMDSLVCADKTALLEKAVGISLRTFQRRKDDLSRKLSPEQSGRLWKFAEILARARAVFGSLEEAEIWLERPAIGLDQQRPIDLLATPPGVDLVESFLERLEYGVYT